MAGTTFQLKRSSVAGKVPNTSTLSIGELGINLTDQILYSSNGTGIFEIGSSITNQTVKSSLTVGNSSVNSTVNSTSISIGSNNLTVGTSAYFVSNGNVGIGTSSPSQKIEVYDGNIQTTSTAGSYVRLVRGDVNGALLQLNRGGSANQNAYYGQYQGSLYIKNLDSGSTIFTNTTGDTERMRITSAGNIGIGTSSPSYPLDVNGNINSSNTVFAVHFDNVSDVSLKDNISPLTNTKETINQLNPVSFNWKSSGEKSYGLIAQEVEQILPSIVHSKQDGTKTVNYIEIIAFLIAAVKDLQRQIDDINSK